MTAGTWIILLIVLCVAEAIFFYVRLLRERRSAQWWYRLYSAQTDHAARTDRRLADRDRAIQQLQGTVHRLRQELEGKRPL